MPAGIMHIEYMKMILFVISVLVINNSKILKIYERLRRRGVNMKYRNLFKEKTEVELEKFINVWTGIICTDL